MIFIAIAFRLLDLFVNFVVGKALNFMTCDMTQIESYTLTESDTLI